MCEWPASVDWANASGVLVASSAQALTVSRRLPFVCVGLEVPNRATASRRTGLESSKILLRRRGPTTRVRGRSPRDRQMSVSPPVHIHACLGRLLHAIMLESQRAADVRNPPAGGSADTTSVVTS